MVPERSVCLHPYLRNARTIFGEESTNILQAGKRFRRILIKLPFNTAGTGGGNNFAKNPAIPAP